MGVKFKSVTFPPSAVPAVPKNGLVYNDSATKQLMAYLNNQWVSLSSGAAGADGREVELQKNSTHIQWRYVGETNWNDLVALADITGSFDDSTLLKLDGSREMTGTLETPEIKSDSIQNKTSVALTITTTDFGSGTDNININSGDSSSNTGNVIIKSGNGEHSGALELTSGSSNTNSSGDILIKTGNSVSGDTGNVIVSSGVSSSGLRGDIRFDSPNIKFNGWPLKFVGSPTDFNDAATKDYVDSLVQTKQDDLGFTPIDKAGDVLTGTLQAPTVKTDLIQNKTSTDFYIETTEASAGAGSETMYIKSGDSTSSTGTVWIKSGTGNNTGNIILDTGTTNGTDPSGQIQIKTGDSSLGTANTGSLTINTGSTTSGDTGQILIVTGVTTFGTRGAISIDSPNIKFNGFSLKQVGEPVNSTDASTKNYVDTQLASKLNVQFGSGVDSNVTVGNGSVITLARDMYYNNLTVSGTGQIKTNGYKIYVNGTLDLTNAQTGAIQNNGNNGGNGGNGTTTAVGSAGVIATATSSNSVGSGGASLAGKAGTNATQAGVAGAAGVAVSIGAGGNGGPSGSGAQGSVAGGLGGAGASGGAVTQFFISRYAEELIKGTSGFILGGAGGAVGGTGGGGQSTSSSSGGSGGAGGGGGVIYITARNLLIGSSTQTGAIQAKGGNAGTTGNSIGVSSSAGGSGGSGGGGGGWVYLVVGNITGTTTNLIDCSGGSGAAGGKGGTGSSSGAPGGTGGGGGSGGRITVINTGSGTITETVGSSGQAGSSGNPAVGATGGNGGAAGSAGTCYQTL